MITRLTSIVFILASFTYYNSVYAQELQDLKPGVVRIYNTKLNEQGTGFIIKIQKDKAYIVSAAHVVEGSEFHQVYLFNRQDEPIRGQVIDKEAGNSQGLALLVIIGDENMFSGLMTLQLEHASQLKGGENVQIIGFPSGTFIWTITSGNVARIEGRNIVFSGSIQGGNSGGPVLFNGKVVGLVLDVNQSFAYAAQAESIAQYANGIKPNLTSIVSDSGDDKNDSIHITKIINPPSGEGVQKSTVWIGASGRLTYIIDSITIQHHPGFCSSIGSGARPPDANYSFNFAYGSSETYALNPALELDPKDRREVSFTLGLAPTGSFPNVCGYVTAVIHYHTSNGLNGTLALKQLPADVKLLAKLLDADVESDGLVVTSRGIQRGKSDDERDTPRLVYEPLGFTQLFYISESKLPEPVPNITLTGHRLSLNSAINKKGAVPSLVKLVESGNQLAFDLCAGLQNPDCLEALVRTGKSGKFIDHALRALAIRHLIKPSNDLADFILSSDISKADKYSGLGDAATAITFYPTGKWAQALLSLTNHRASFVEGLYIRRNELTETERSRVEEFCWKQFDAFFPEKAAMLYLLWRGHHKSLIGAKLRTLPLSLIKDTDAYRYRNYREYLNEELFGTKE